MLKRKDLKRVGTLIRIQKAGKNYAIDPKKLDRVFEAVCRFPNTDREYYDLKPVSGIDLTGELEEWK